MAKIPIENILFIDIETVPMASQYDALDENFKSLWDKKSVYLSKSDEDDPSTLFERAGIYAEFGKIVCISAGRIQNDEIKTKSYYSHNEKKLLQEFADDLSIFTRNIPNLYLCAHNGKEFDFPYIIRRMIINQIPIPYILNTRNKNRYELPFIDTMEMWKFGDYKHFTSLALLCELFGIPTPKDDIDGSEVARVYYEENDLERIKLYCEKDVTALIEVYKRLDF
ncbi:MAG: 3'-5' exonuclease [Bacteroidales bacterium]|nr:3'-5' exonuclease [Bacteroidales bacterium]